MKKILTLLVLLLSLHTPLLAQNDQSEKSAPLHDAELIRKVWKMDIEGEIYSDVTVFIKSIRPDHFFTDKYKVKVQVTDSDGRKIWNKTFKNAYLYVFSNGQVQVGRPKFHQLVIYDSKFSSKYERGIIREKEGVY